MEKKDAKAAQAGSSKKESLKRQELLSMEPTRLVLKTALPLLLYSCVQIAFQFFDILTVANISQEMVSTVLLVNDLQMVFNMIFVSVSIAVGIRISHAFGAGNMETIRHDISTVFFMTLFTVSAVVCVCIPLSGPIMRFCAFPEELLPECMSVIFLIHGRRVFLKTVRQETANDRLANAVKALGRLDASDWRPNGEKISIPTDLFLQMREAMGGTMTEEEMVEAYQYALVEARIDELEKTERVD